MPIETENRDAVYLLEAIQCEVQVALAMIDAAHTILRAQKQGQIGEDCFIKRPPDGPDPVQSVLCEASAKLCEARDAMTVFEGLNWRSELVRRKDGDTT